MAKYDYDMIVIGGGAAGLTASTFAGQSAAKTLLIEKEEKLGGDCLHYGCVPSKTLIKSAYAYNVMRNAEKYGLPKAGLPPVDFAAVRARIRRTIGTIQEHDEPRYLADTYNVETAFGEAKFTDERTIILNGRRITGRYFVIATGSSPSVPPVEGIADVPYITNMQVFSLERLPASMIVLGGGPIGLEMAQAFHRLGCRVTVAEFAPRVLAREDEDVSGFITGVLKQEGLQVRTSATAVKAGHDGAMFTLTVEENGKASELRAEALLVAAGRKPNVEGLDLEKAGVRYGKSGIPVDGKMRTNIRHIYACGDVNGQLPFTHVASYEAVVAVYNAILKIPKAADYTNIPWVTYLDPEVASIGYNETRAKEAGIAYTRHVESFERNDRALAEGENRGFIKILMNKKGAVIGVQIVGHRAGDLIAEWIPVLNAKIKLPVIAGAVHPYPTMAEINKTASVKYLVSTIPSWTKAVTKFLFGYQGRT